jgi:predicted dehydrogenase
VKFLIVGCGSMGKRRARCLRTLGFADIAATDPREDRRREIADESQVDIYAGFDEALSERADFALICVPPHLHAHYLLRCVGAGLPAFCEAPLTLTLEDTDAVIEAAAQRRVFIAPSCTYLHNAIHRKVKGMIESCSLGRLLAYVSHAGQHVADWHPYEDYRGFYASKRCQGGMCLDMLPHEFQMLTHFAGDVTALTCMARMRNDAIETDDGACDVYDVILDTTAGVSAVVHHDMFQRPPGVYRKLMFERGAVEFDWRALRVAEYQGPNWLGEVPWGDDSLDGYDFEQMYLEELRHALAALEGEENYMMPPHRDRRILELVLACEESSRRNVHISW